MRTYKESKKQVNVEDKVLRSDGGREEGGFV
jgi:hypothetical protein